MQMAQLYATIANDGVEVQPHVVTRIDGVIAPKTGYWELFVNGYPAQLGAADVILTKTDSVVWIADDDYSAKNGPFVYDLRATTGARR